MVGPLGSLIYRIFALDCAALELCCRSPVRCLFVLPLLLLSYYLSHAPCLLPTSRPPLPDLLLRHVQASHLHFSPFVYPSPYSIFPVFYSVAAHGEYLIKLTRRSSAFRILACFVSPSSSSSCSRSQVRNTSRGGMQIRPGADHECL